MLDEVAYNLLNRLMGDYKPGKWPNAAIAAAVGDLLSEPDTAAQMAYDEIIRRNNRLPTIDTVIKTVQFHGAQIRTAEAREREDQERRHRANSPTRLPEGQSEYGRAAAALINKFCDAADRGEIIPARERMKMMARLADKYQRVELAHTIMDEWAMLPAE